MTATAPSSCRELIALPCAESASTIRTGARVGSCYHASRLEGERRINELARSARLEEAWAYLEAQSLWIAVGKDRRPRSVEMDFTPVCRRLAESGSTKGARVFLYHIHPRTTLPGGMIHPPSANDIYSGANLKRALRDHYHATLIAGVIDGSGVWTYDVTDALERSLRLPDYSHDSPRWIAYSEARPYRTPRELMRERYADFVVDFVALLVPVTKNERLSREEKIAAYLQKARVIGVVATYRPLSAD